MTLPLSNTNSACTGPRGRCIRSYSDRRAFTLIELILVLGLLGTIAGIVVPRFSSFLKGQDLGQEGRRFIALTQYAQSQAISTGLAQTVWVDESEKTYGIREAYAYSAQTNSGKVYNLGNQLEFEIDPYAAQAFGEFAIRFLPDGMIEEGSLTNVIIERPEFERIAITLATNGLDYEITRNAPRF
jgi:prepilin-type N-terminal cleavage/methylation domain-containing protein